MTQDQHASFIIINIMQYFRVLHSGVGWLVGLKAALHYGGEVHRSVKSFSPRHGYLRQGMDGMLEKMKS